MCLCGRVGVHKCGLFVAHIFVLCVQYVFRKSHGFMFAQVGHGFVKIPRISTIGNPGAARCRGFALQSLAKVGVAHSRAITWFHP